MSHESTSDYLEYRDSKAGRPTTPNGPKLTPKDLFPHIARYSSPIALGDSFTKLKDDIATTDKGTNSKPPPTNPIPPKDVNSKPPQKLLNGKYITGDDRDL